MGKYSRRLLRGPTVRGTMIGAPPKSSQPCRTHRPRLRCHEHRAVGRWGHRAPTGEEKKWHGRWGCMAWRFDSPRDGGGVELWRNDTPNGSSGRWVYDWLHGGFEKVQADMSKRVGTLSGIPRFLFKLLEESSSISSVHPRILRSFLFGRCWMWLGA